MRRSFLTGLVACLLSSTGMAAPNWTEDLLFLAGTTLVFDQPAVNQALAQGQTPSDLGRLLSATGLKPWAGARLWLVSRTEQGLQTFNPPDTLKNEAERRGLWLNNTLNPNDQTQLNTLVSNKKLNFSNLATLLKQQDADALVIMSGSISNPHWQLYSRDLQISGDLNSNMLGLLADIWAENLALNWQWPELKQAALIEVHGLTDFPRYKYTEKNLASVCSAIRLLQIQGTTASFACVSPNSTVPENLRLLPHLTTTALVDHGLDENLLLGGQLSQRYGVYRWTDNSL